MKTIITGFIALFLMLFSFSFALAENDTINVSVVSNETPVLISAPVDIELENISEEEASGSLFWKEVGLWFTFNQEKKAEKELHLAELQLVRARIAAKNNNTRAMEKAIEAHQKLIEKVKERVSRFDNASGNVTKLIGLDRAIQVHQLRIDRLNAFLNDSNLTAEQIEKLQERIGQAQENTDHLREVANERRLEFEKKLREKNVSDDDSEDENKTEEDKDSSDDLNDDSNESEDSDDSDDDSNKTDDNVSGTVLSGSGQSGNAYS